MRTWLGGPALSPFRLDKLTRRLRERAAGAEVREAHFVYFADLHWPLSAEDEARLEARAVLVTERVAETFEAVRLGPAANAAWRAAEAAVLAAPIKSAAAATNETAKKVVGAFETYDPCFLLR